MNVILAGILKLSCTLQPCLPRNMSWKSSAVLLALSFLGVGSLVYLLYHNDEEKEAEDCLKLKTSRCTVIEVKIPRECVGIVIGRGGSTIKDIQAKSDTRINFKNENATDEYRVCVIRGTAEAAQYAESLIHEVIVSQPLIETYEMLVPVQACGRIIGKNGENIRQISRESNAKIIVENVPSSPVSQDRKIIIKGSAEQIAIAKVLVEQKVEEDFEFRTRIETNLANRSPRHKAKYLLPGPGEAEAVDTSKHKEKLVATGSDGLFEVYVSAMENPERLWVQMKGPCTVNLDRLNEQMTEYYSKEENRELHVLKEVTVGQTVAAPFMYDEKWYRAEVSEVSNGDYEPEEADLTLYYVDYGDSSTCKQKDVFELRTDFLHLRFQAIECILAKVKPSGDKWSEESVDMLEDLTHVALWKSLMAKIDGYKERPTRAQREGSPVPCVELYDMNGPEAVNVAQELVNNGHAVWEVVQESKVNGSAEKETLRDESDSSVKLKNVAESSNSAVRENGDRSASTLE